MNGNYRKYTAPASDACGIGAVVNINGVPTHGAVSDALTIVERLGHRAGTDITGKTGDGVGIMVQIPHRFFAREVKGLPAARDYGVGMFFLPQSGAQGEKERFGRVCAARGLDIIAWRKVPADKSVLGEKALATCPVIEQCFIRRPEGVSQGLGFDRELYAVRRIFENEGAGETYVCSLSSRTVVYKGMFLVGQLRAFYADLSDELFESAIASVHSRFSTNTDPSWERAHPNRIILHNGEINTIRGNVLRMAAREDIFRSALHGSALENALPVISASGSDSAMLDNALEFFMMNGVPLPLAVMTMIPEPWRNDPSVCGAKRDMYRYYATMMEPWDGPAAVIFSDGDILGATLDRNGLRPARYLETTDGRLILSSETGVLDIPAENIKYNSRLMPGRMLLVDTAAGRVISDEECKAFYSGEKPYGEWVAKHLTAMESLPAAKCKAPEYTDAERARLLAAFGYNYEEINEDILSAAATGGEPTASMGVDIPLAFLDKTHRLLFDYFKQLFAQVTNPPIDSLREKIVTDTAVYAGNSGITTAAGEASCTALRLQSPLLTEEQLAAIKALDGGGLKAACVSAAYDITDTLEKAVGDMLAECERAREGGANIIILSDRGVDKTHAAIPSLLAVSAAAKQLSARGGKKPASVILESGEPRTVHHFAALLGYGACAVCPYLAHESIRMLVSNGALEGDAAAAIEKYDSAMLGGIVKIASKMGISTVQSYQFAQRFEAVGLDSGLVEKYFPETACPVGGVGISDLGADVLFRHAHAFDPNADLTPESPGMHRLRSGAGAEDHLYSPRAIVALREATHSGDYEKFLEYSRIVNDENKPHTLRGLLDFKYDENGGIPITEVEPEEEIVKRFKTGAMSYGSISYEAHTCMAIAMNRLGGKSNSGEGGEAPERYGTEMNSAIKQVASGRFGVTSAYLCSAKEIQIKMAQGAKPGEGGHLPGKKVYPWVAATRYSTPGVSLISPPPHHDIYSIEDLAQLIYDLKSANRGANVTVKLVSEDGVGTIASGVAKAGADGVLVSGFDGGTGAAPKSSIHNAGLPWETGVAQAHRELVANGLRHRVRLETDGKLMTGRDVAVACMLGAEEFGFATAPLVSMGCVMMRVCNLDTCPVGIATQNPELRRRFCGKPEYVMNFMLFVARELREIMARLGVRTVGELVGRSDLLVQRKSTDERLAGAELSALVGSNANEHYEQGYGFDFRFGSTPDVTALIPAFEPCFERNEKHSESLNVKSTDRAFGTILGSEITRRFGNALEPGAYTVNCRGNGGQSFGAFIPKGLSISLCGDANDYFGKGLSGGRLAVFPEPSAAFDAHDNVIIGNVALYGATGGEAYVCGVAGERFCVRNSGAVAVAEGCGDHGCEYMTGGIAVILGKTGRNFAAGMSGGVAYVFDEDGCFGARLNGEMVTVSHITESEEAERLRGIIADHVAATGSEFGRRLLDDFENGIEKFVRLMPKDYGRMVEATKRFEREGFSHEEAEMKAFSETHG